MRSSRGAFSAEWLRRGARAAGVLWRASDVAAMGAGAAVLLALALSDWLVAELRGVVRGAPRRGARAGRRSPAATTRRQPRAHRERALDAGASAVARPGRGPVVRHRLGSAAPRSGCACWPRSYCRRGDRETGWRRPVARLAAGRDRDGGNRVRDDDLSDALDRRRRPARQSRSPVRPSGAAALAGPTYAAGARSGSAGRGLRAALRRPAAASRAAGACGWLPRTAWQVGAGRG
jgi:hypothetical protein